MPSRHWLCTQCGAQTSAPLRVAPGSSWVTLVLAVPFVVPAIVYAVWRHTSRRDSCPTCGHAQLIPADAPLARTWRSMGWISGRPPADAQATSSPDIRLERIEQAIDAIAGEVDRVAQAQRVAQHLLAERGATRSRDQEQVTPT